jgi:alanyl-tRNA synthetase
MAMTPRELRDAYLQFFRDRGHTVISSALLVPENDPSTLFTSSGMQPLVPYLLGQPHPAGKRLVDSQKSFRSQDIEEVGDNRHTTFFEMLGNWSLGDYFKAEQLEFFFTFLTQVLKLDPARLYVTVFRGNEELGVPRDDESVTTWKKLFAQAGITARDVDNAERDGMGGGRIFYYSEKKNWWSRSGVPAAMPPGEPGGPDSEVFFDFGTDLKLHEHSAYKNEPCHVNCDCGRFLEIGNSVFMQYQKQADGSFQELPQKNVDFGGGFERLLAAMQNNPDVFLTDIFQPLLHVIDRLGTLKYTDLQLTPAQRAAMRVVMDHLRAATFLIIDGVTPSNKAQGYVLRRLIRRSVMKARVLQLPARELLVGIAQAVMSEYDGVHNVVAEDHEPLVSEVIQAEVERFEKRVQEGLRALHKAAKLTGKVAFDLYQSFGFPFELTLELAQERGEVVNQEEFQRELVHHQELSRTASVGMFKGGLADHSAITTRYHTATHLLHAALRKVLGEHVQQKGSHITAERLRFDFAFSRKLTDIEILNVENEINKFIDQKLPVNFVVMSKDEAEKTGALHFFGEKYGDSVKVYYIGNAYGSSKILRKFS